MTTAPAPMAPVADDGLAYGPMSRADVLALVATWVGFVGGLVLKLEFGGWMVLLIFIYSPLIIGLPVAGAAVLTHALAAHSSTRRRYGHVPGRYRLLAWTIGAGILVAGSAMPDGGDEGPTTSALVALLGTDGASDGWTTVSMWAWGAAAVASVVAVVLVVRDRIAVRKAARTA